MESEQEKIKRILNDLTPGDSQYFHTGPMGTGDPVLINKKAQTSPTLLNDIDKPHISKSIMDPRFADLNRKKRVYEKLADYLE